MTEYAVLHLYADGRSAVAFWANTADEVIEEAIRLNRDADKGHGYRAVQTTRYGYFESLTADSLYAA
jgi:hypothetical protein